MDIKTASVQELYNDMSSKWEALSELFSKKDERGKPRLAVFSIDYEGKKGGLSSLIRKARFFAGFECLPFGLPFKDKKIIFNRFLEDIPEACYYSYYHLIAFNRDASRRLDCDIAMPEEVTHSIVQVKGSTVSVDAIATEAFNGYSSYFGHKIYSAVNLLGIGGFDVKINEFFPPLGQSHILGKKIDNYKYTIDDAVHRRTYFQPEKTKEERASEVRKIICYLPALAGMMLTKQYKHGIRALLKEHPSLTNLDGKQVWEQYCMPLLIRGKL